MKRLLEILIGILLVVLFFHLIGPIAIILLIGLIVFIIKVIVEYVKIRKEIEQDPQAYYSNQQYDNSDVIDVTYTEKEVEEEK